MRPTAASRWNKPTWKFKIASLAGLLVLGLMLFISGSASASDNPDGVGLWDPATGQWHLLHDDGSIDSFYFGRPGDIPIFGDWDCDGTDTAGMFRPSSGFAYLTNRNQTSTASIRFHFGDIGDIPIVGDWNGDGCDTLGVYRAGEVLLRNDLTTGPAHTRFFFGTKDDTPFVGDFDGDGVSTLGLYRAGAGLVYLRNRLSSGPADHTFFYGESGDRIVAGDWDHDGSDTIGIYRPVPARFYLSNRNANQEADRVLDFGEASWVPVAGSFDRTGRPTPPPNPLPAAGVGEILYRVNAGGPGILANDGGPDWTGDTTTDPSSYTNETAALSSIASWNVSSIDASVASSIPVEMFATERWDQPAGHEMLWRFPVPEGTLVKVNLYFSSGYDPVGEPGERVFNVRAHDSIVTKDFDIARSAGHRVGTRRSFYAYSDNGYVDVWFEHVTNNPQLNGIEIISQDGAELAFDAVGTPTENGDLLRHSLTQLAMSQPVEGGTVHLGPGTFASRPDAHDPVFHLVTNMTIRGAGRDATTIVGASTGGPAVAGATGSGLEDVTVEIGNARGARGILNRFASADYRHVTVRGNGPHAEAIVNISSSSTFDDVIVEATSSGPLTVVNNVGGAPGFANLSVEATSKVGVIGVKNDATSATFDTASILVSSDTRTAYGMLTTGGSVIAGSNLTIAPSINDTNAASNFYGLFMSDSTGDFTSVTVTGERTHASEIGAWIAGGEAHLDNLAIELRGDSANATGLQIEAATVSVVRGDIAIVGNGTGVSADSSHILLEAITIQSGAAATQSARGIEATNGSLDVVDGTVAVRGTNTAVALALDAVEATFTGGTYLASSTSSAIGVDLTSGRAMLSSVEVTASAASPVAVVVNNSHIEIHASQLVARDGAEGTVLQSRTSDIAIEDSILAVDAGGGRATAIENIAPKPGTPGSSDPAGVVRVVKSTITAATHMVLNLAGVPTFLEQSTLNGGDITDPKAEVVCVNVTDEHGVLYEETCPIDG